jgi:release factor glutamine methyltransferase
MLFERENYQLREAFQILVRELISFGSKSAHLDARLLIGKAFGISSETFLLKPETELNPDKISILNSIVSRRLAHEPMAYILGKKEFWSLRFLVNKSVLIPRPETETIIECVIGRIPNRKSNLHILDLGTGSGCVLLALLNEFHHAFGVGIDISSEAIAVAQENASRNGLENRSAFRQGDWESNADNFIGNYDIVVSNPPYIPTKDIGKLDKGVTKYEPVQSIDGGKDGLRAYRYILEKLPILLNKDGFAVFEVGFGQVAPLKKILEQSEFKILEIREDLASISRVVLVGWKIS